MKTLLLKADYTDDTGEFWRDSYIKNMTVKQLEGETIHDTVKRAVEDTDGVQLSYNGKPQQNIYKDDKDGDTKIVGYIYRAKDEIDGKKALFDLWVEIRAIDNIELTDIEQ